MTAARIQTFFEPVTATATHVLSCPVSGAAAVIDSVLDYDPKSGRTRTASADRVRDHVRAEGLRVEWHLETHAHADHLSAAPYLKCELGGRIAIGSRIREVQAVFSKVFNAPDIARSADRFDELFSDGHRLALGSLQIEVLHTPGHTPACVTYLVGEDAFVGDTIFMPDVGTARCDFPGGDAPTLYRSIRRLLALPPQTRLHLCHDYPPAARAPHWLSTVAEQRAANIHVHDGVGEAEFVALRQARDRTLEVPTLLLPSVQVNARAGHLPPAESDGRHYLKIPVDVL